MECPHDAVTACDRRYFRLSRQRNENLPETWRQLFARSRFVNFTSVVVAKSKSSITRVNLHSYRLVSRYSHISMDKIFID
jgi:hypothetical protein